MSYIASCLKGMVIETFYIDSQSDLSLLPTEYQNSHPCPSSIGSHRCNHALFEIEINGIFVGESRLSNDSGSASTPLTPNGTSVCKDFENTPAPLTAGTWTGNPKSRYSRIVITATKANQIASASVGNSINIQLKGALTTYFSGGGACSTSSHNDVTWVRIYSSSGAVLYNSCLNNNTTPIYICPICVELDIVTKKNPLTKEKCFGISPVMGVFNNKVYYKVNSCGQSAAGFLVWIKNGSVWRWEYHQYFNPTTGLVSGEFYGYNTASLPWNGTWVLSSPTTERQIISVKEDASVCENVTTTTQCPCLGLITSKR